MILTTASGKNSGFSQTKVKLIYKSRIGKKPKIKEMMNKITPLLSECYCKRFFFLILSLSAFLSLPAQTSSADDAFKTLRFKYKAGDSYRILSTVNEDVKINGRLNNSAEIVNRVSVKITGTDDGGRGKHEAVFMTTESSVSAYSSKTLHFGEEYESEFYRDTKGVYEISDEYFMPVVRDVPLLPEKPVKAGDEWTAGGHEAHDLRRSFGIEKPFKVPFTAKYTYLRDEKGISSDVSKTEKNFQVIGCRYNIFYESPSSAASDDFLNNMYEVPVTTMGYSNQTIWWDNEKGQIDHYTEDFRIILQTNLGNSYEFVGTAHAEVTEFERTATEEKVREVQQKIEEMNIENVNVVQDDKGLTLSIENIQFKPNSAELADNEQEKLEKIAQIVSQFPNDLLISGHTAKVGTPESCQALSEERADSVARFFIEKGVRDKYHIFTQGFGERIPVASNSTVEGRSRNRRVEITIMDE